MTIDRELLRTRLDEELARFDAAHPRSRALAAAAREHLLAGVPMPWMVRWPGGFPLFVERASGARFVDVDGHEYVDFCLGDTGAMTGHGPAPALAAIRAQLERGLTFDAADRGRHPGGRGAGAPLRPPLLAVRDSPPPTPTASRSASPAG